MGWAAACLCLSAPAVGQDAGANGQSAPVLRQESDATSGRARSGQPGALVDENWLRGDVLILRGLDKVTATTQDFTVRLGEQARFGALTVFMPTPCAKRPPELTPQTWAGLEVYERQTDGSGQEVAPKLIFSGWMLAESPALNPLEHPVFDVWPLDCVVPEDIAEPPASDPARASDAAPR